MAKQIVFHEEARAKIKKGIDAVAKAVGVTIGPFGRNVVLQKPYGGPTITNDGVSIARDITLEDAFENVGAEVIKEVANKTNELAGDGTSTSVILAQSMIEEGLKQIDKGVNALSVRRGMERAHKVVEERLGQMKRDISNDAEVVHIASVSAESEEFGKIIAETVQKVGDKGVVTVEESQSFGIESEVVEGLEIENGYVSPYMMTNPDRLESEYKDVPVLVTDEKISGVKEILPFLEKLTQMGSKDLVIIADDIEGEALTTFVLNKLRGTFNVLAVKAPGFGDRKKICSAILPQPSVRKLSQRIPACLLILSVLMYSVVLRALLLRKTARSLSVLLMLSRLLRSVFALLKRRLVKLISSLKKKSFRSGLRNFPVVLRLFVSVRRLKRR